MLPTASNTTNCISNDYNALSGSRWCSGPVVGRYFGDSSLWGKHECAARHFVPTAGTRSLFYHPFRWLTFTRHAYVTPGSGVGPQVGKRALIATTVGGPLYLSMLYSVMASPPDDKKNWRWHRLTLPPESGSVWPACLLPQCPPTTAKYIACWSEGLISHVCSGLGWWV